MDIVSGTQIGSGARLVATFRQGVDLSSSHLTILRGANGSGKTTLLKALQGLISFRPKQKEFSALQPLARSLYLPERLDWAEDMCFSEGLNDLCPSGFRGEAAEFATLAKQLELPPQTPYGILSKGNRQKMSVLLAEATARFRAVSWLLLDEPLSGLDTDSQAVLIDFWQHRKPDGIRRLISSHGDAARFIPGLIIQFAEGGITSAASLPVGTGVMKAQDC